MDTILNEGARDLGADEPSSAQFHLAFQRVEADIRAVPERDLVPLNLDVPSTVATVLGSVPEIRALRPTIATVPIVDMAMFDKIKDYALALAHAHSMYRAAAGAADNVGALAAKAIELRDILHTDAAALVRRRLLDAVRVANLRSGNAYKNIAFDLTGLVELFLEHWSEIAGRTGLQREELEEARLIASQLIAGIGQREQAPVAVGAAARLRQQAFTLLLRAYDEVRRAVQFVRWHENDANEIAPSLYAGRGGRGGTEIAPTPELDPTEPGTAVDAPPPGASAPSAATSAGVPSPGMVPIGFPGAAPFVRS